MVSPPNGSPSSPPGPPQVIPKVALIYRQLEHGARQIVAVEVGGTRFGGIVAIDTGADLTKPSSLPQNVVRLTLETVWPFEWKDEREVGSELVVAREVPPIRPGPGFKAP